MTTFSKTANASTPFFNNMTLIPGGWGGEDGQQNKNRKQEKSQPNNQHARE